MIFFREVKVGKKSRKVGENYRRMKTPQRPIWDERIQCVQGNKLELNEPKMFLSPLRSYRAYSKIKAVLENYRKNPSTKLNLNPKTVPQLPIDPEYQSMSKYFSGKVNNNLRVLPSCLPKVQMPKVNTIQAQETAQRTVAHCPFPDSARKVILSRTPDPSKREERVIKAEIESSDSESSLFNTHDY